MGKHVRPIIGPITDHIPMPERKSPGVKPYNIDDQAVSRVIDSINDGTFKTQYAAVRAMAREISNNEKAFNAAFKRLSRKVKNKLIHP